MSIGTGVVLFVIGAILAFALNVQVEWIDLTFVGYLLMAAGVIVFIVGIALLLRRRSSRTTVHSAGDGGERITERQTDSDVI